jgi:hypothetical protein
LRPAHATALALLAVTAPAAHAQGRIAINANPSAIIAAEIALGQLARKKGEDKAMLDTSVENAIVVEEEPAPVADWLKARTSSTESAKWNARSVWMSCDGTIGVAEGIWSQDGESGRFAAVWQLQKKNSYKWVLRHREAASAVRADPYAFLTATVADCPARPERRPPPDAGKPKTQKAKPPPPSPVDPLNGSSPDKSLAWRSGIDETGARQLHVEISKDGGMKTVLGAEFER